MTTSLGHQQQSSLKTESRVPEGERHGISEYQNMINEKRDSNATAAGNGSSGGGHEHSAIMGDRHGVAAEDHLKEQAGMTNDHQE